MNQSIKGTKTEKKLLAAFAGESQARTRYTYFSSVAEKEGYLQIAELFRETADNEKEHAKRFFKFMEGGMVEIIASYPAGKIGTTAENLKAAAAGEHEEWTQLYPEGEKIARAEGFPEVAQAFAIIAQVEIAHEKRYNRLLDNINQKQVFKKNTSVLWKCRNCGYIHTGAEAPEICPTCLHPQKHFELFVENY